METASKHLGDSSHKLRAAVFDPTRFVLEQSWQPFFIWGAITTMQMHCESGGYTRRRGLRGERRLCTCGSWSVSPKVLGAAGQDVVPPGLLMCKLFITALVSSSCVTNCLLYHYPFKNLGLKSFKSRDKVSLGLPLTAHT